MDWRADEALQQVCLKMISTPTLTHATSMAGQHGAVPHGDADGSELLLARAHQRTVALVHLRVQVECCFCGHESCMHASKWGNRARNKMEMTLERVFDTEQFQQEVDSLPAELGKLSPVSFFVN